MHHAPRTALIVGAGIGGLAAAIAVRHAGLHVRVVERAENPRELGFALNLAPNAIAALRELGVADPILAEGHRPARVEVRHPSGRVLKRLDIGSELTDSSAANVIALRPVLHGALLSAAGANALSLGWEAETFHEAGGGVVLAGTDGRTISADVLVGADGQGSTVRQRLHPTEPPRRRSGYWALRGVAHEAAQHLGDLSGVAYLGHGIEAATVRAGRTAVYWYVSLLADDVASAVRDPFLVLDRCVPIADQTFRAIARHTKPADLRLDELFERAPIREWGRGRVTLLGDAAHPMLPHTGQGAAQALEDAVALGLALSRGDDVPAALRLYERVRTARTRRVVASGRRIAAVTTTKNSLITLTRDLAIRAMPRALVAAALRLRRERDPHRTLR